MMYTQKDLDKAEIDAAKALDNGEDLHPEVKRKIKANFVMKGLKKDANNKDLEIAIVLSKPVQDYINRSFRADQATLSHVEDVCATPTDSDGTLSASVNETMEKAIASNLAIIDGTEGRAVTSKLQGLLRDHEAEEWKERGMFATFCWLKI